MVPLDTQIPNHIDHRTRFSWKGAGTETSHDLTTSEGFSLGLVKSAWESIVNHLRVPHFSHTKRLNLIHYTNLPCILNENVVISVIPLEVPLMSIHPKPQLCGRRLAYHMCSLCFETSLVYSHMEDILYCSECGTQTIYEPPVTYVRQSRKLLMSRQFSLDFSKRLVHFRFWLKRLQGKEKHNVPDEVVQNIKTLLQRDNTKVIHYWVIRAAIRRLRYDKYYDNTIYIMSRVRGTPLVNLTKSQEQSLEKMFLSMQDAFQKLRHIRVNMISYPYIIKKICELRGWNYMAQVIPTLKSHTRIILQDELWKHVCEEMNWTFIPTSRWSVLETRVPTGKIN